MTPARLYALFPLVALAIATQTAPPPINHGLIMGRVTDLSGTGVPYATVSVLGLANAIRTGTGGSFVLDVATGIHTIRASAFGYITNEQAGVVVNTGSTTTLDFVLRLRGGLDEPVRSRAYAVPPDSALQLRISSRSGATVHLKKRKYPPPPIDVTLRNTGPDTLVLLRPGSVFVTPIVTWIVRTRDGRRLSPETVGYCGNRGPLTQDVLFSLAPGDSQRLTLSFPTLFQYEKETYAVQLVYENDPSRLFGSPLGDDDAEAVRQLRGSTPCKLVSDLLVVKVRP